MQGSGRSPWEPSRGDVAPGCAPLLSSGAFAAVDTCYPVFPKHVQVLCPIGAERPGRGSAMQARSVPPRVSRRMISSSQATAKFDAHMAERLSGLLEGLTAREDPGRERLDHRMRHRRGASVASVRPSDAREYGAGRSRRASRLTRPASLHPSGNCASRLVRMVIRAAREAGRGCVPRSDSLRVLHPCRAPRSGSWPPPPRSVE